MTPNNQIITILLIMGATCIMCSTFLIGLKAGLLGSGLVCLSMAYRIMAHTRRD
jgi:hypothetical protein